jgi:selenide,water dikinase
LAEIPHIENERILATWSGGEDAALWKIDDPHSASGRLGVLTVDFITPVVDDPYVWGQVAAANSISDVFAMGGRPIVALNVVGFPTKKLGLDVLKKILAGGFSKTREAGAFLAGGHSVQDNEPKYGLVVYGEVEEDKMWRTVGARDQDLLILTKPIGTGIVITGIKANMVENPETVAEATRWMTTLNDIPRRLSGGLYPAVHAATDVTGFGLAGHVLDMLSEGRLDCRLSLENIPLLPDVRALADMGLIPEGSYRNRAAYENQVEIVSRCNATDLDFLFDAQTSGGLLLALAPDRAEEVLRVCREAGFDNAAAIGKFEPGEGKIKLGQ